MKKYIFLFILSILFPLAAHSQYGWIQQQSNTGNDLNGINFLDPNTGYAVGYNGSILKTTNGGTNWTFNTLNNYGYRQVVFPQADSGLVFGLPGICYKTTDRGQTWFLTFISLADTYTYAYFINEYTGWVLSNNGRVYKTENGGYNWAFEPASTNAMLYSCSFINENTGWVCGGFGMVSKTVNGGDIFINMPAGVSNDLYGITFVNGNTGWVCGSGGLIMKSTNGCISWTPQNSGVTNNLSWIYFTDVNTGYVCGSSGVILKTTNGGTIWYRQPVSTNGQLNRIIFIDHQNGWVCGNNGEIYKTTNGGDPLPAVPALISPPDNSWGISLTPALTWTNTGAVNYQVQVSTAPDFSVITDSSSVTSSVYTVPAGKLILNRTYYWRVRAYYYYGTSEWSVIWNFTTLVSGVTILNATVPASYNLYQNYPNPFNPSTNIRFDVPKTSNVKLIVYDINGRVVENLFSGNIPAGSFEYKWNASKYSSGIYFFRMESNEYSAVRKMTLLK